MIPRPHLFPLLLALALSGCAASDDASEPDKPGHEAGHDQPPEDADHNDADENRTTITAAMADAAGIVVAPAGPGVIRDEHEVQGLLTPVEGRHARVVARFPGPLKSLHVGVGDTVRVGQTGRMADAAAQQRV